MDEILDFLLKSNVDRAVLEENVLPHLEKEGFHKLPDLNDLEVKDLDIEGLSNLDRRRLWRLLEGAEIVSEAEKLEILGDGTDKIDIRYIPCASGLFAADIKECTLQGIQPSCTTMNEMVSMIVSEMKLLADEDIDLYTYEGYPLHINECTGNVKIENWGIDDGELFYVMKHKRDQPGIENFVSLPGLDHDIGLESFSVEMPFQDVLKVNAYIGVDSPEDIAQKIHSLTGVPVPYMSLYIRRGYNYEKLSAYSELEDKDIIRVILRNPNELLHPRSIHYGRRSYKSLLQHSEKGISKFYSILKYLCSPQSMNPSYCFENLLSYLMHLTNFPPLVYSLKVLYQQSYLSISGWVALMESCFALFQTILQKHCIDIPQQNVFEYSDYLWGFIIRKSLSNPKSSIEFEEISTKCAISGNRIMTPVKILDDLCDEINVENHPKYRKEKRMPLKKRTKILFKCYPFDMDTEVFQWEPSKPRAPMVCESIDLNIHFLDLHKSLEELHILNPAGLFAGTGCLTYLEKGDLLYFAGFAKTTDQQRRLYNPNSERDDYLELYSKENLKAAGNSQPSVFLDLAAVWKEKKSMQSEQDEACSLRTTAIIPPNKSIQWEPEEAVVVLLDRSGSMNSQIYPNVEMRCIDAAIQLFNAFATKSQAYKLHNCFGLTIFDHEIDEKLSVTKNLESFEESLTDKIKPRGGTSLTDAMIHGVKQLQQFSCKRRILCLTDGFNGSRNYSYTEVLEKARAEHVIVDTILLELGGNDVQKAISLASGGICVIPHSMAEALKLFEMDSMLSLSQRTVLHQSNQDLDFYKSCSYHAIDELQSSCIKNPPQLNSTTIERCINLNVPPQSQRQKRLLKELRDLNRNKHECISVFPSQTSYDKWNIVLCGPEKTPYEGGAFLLRAHFPERYPGEPPHIIFLTPIYHCNISGNSGRICHSVLGTSYTPSLSMRHILSSIYGLLMCPDLDSPLDGVLTDKYYQVGKPDGSKTMPEVFTQEYFSNAVDWVKKYANKSFAQLCKECSGDNN